jgi:hypothetical protein
MIRNLLGWAAVAAMCTGAAGCAAESDVAGASFAVEGELCGDHATPIITTGNVQIGNAVVSNSETDLVIDISSSRFGWFVKSLSIYAGTAPVPKNSVGNVFPSFFPIQLAFAAPLPGSHTLTIPLADLGVEPGTCTDIHISIFAKMTQLDSRGGIIKSETGWAFGETTFTPEGYSFLYAMCCPPPPPPDEEPPPPEEDAGCTLTQGYWKNHSSKSRGKKNIDWPAPEDEDTLLCGRTWYDILHTNPRGGNAWYILAHQFIAASLNVASGASTPDQVDDALAEAAALLAADCGPLPASSNPDAINLAGILDAYNNGDVGPGHCD